MKRSLFIRIFFAFILVIAALTLLSAIISFSIINRQYEHVLAGQLTSNARSLAMLLEPRMGIAPADSLDALVKQLGRNSGFRKTIIQPDGQVLADSETDPAQMESHGDRPEIILALSGVDGSSHRHSATLQRNMLYVAVPLWKHGEVTGVLRLSLFNRQIAQLRNMLKSRLMLMFIPVTLLTLGLALLLSRSLARPIGRLTAAAGRVAAGDLSVQVRMHRGDEIQTLADRFNEMVEALRESSAQRQRQTDLLNAIIASLNEGLCVLDADDRVLHASNSFRAMFPSTGGGRLWEHVRDETLGAFVEELRRTGGADKRTLELNDRVLLCSGSVLPDYGHIVLLFYDLTALAEADRRKKEFVSNVSHELKTPLTSIKGFLETLQEMVPDEEARHYLEIIDRNTNRLIYIVKDLLLLSTLEAGQAVEFKLVSPAAVIQSVCALFRKKVEQKGLNLRLELPPNLPDIEADDYQLEQVLVNLVQNALQYTEEGEIAVGCAWETDRLHIWVSDTGVGIPQQHLPRLFERFYVVDKSRSKKYGGTGLGLSIVKHVVERHSGELRVESQTGRGATFHVWLPLRQGEEG